jgi:type IV pilus assembly protein PilN
MYSLDINLLSERPEYQSGRQAQSKGASKISTAKYGKVPLYIGGAVAVIALAATGGGWLLLGQQTTQLEAKQKDLDTKLGSLKAQDARLAAISAETTQITGETQALASIFNQVQPWSAVLQDLRESIPQGVQISSVTQSEKPGTGVTAPPPQSSSTMRTGNSLVDKINNVPNPEAPKTPDPAATPVAATAATAPIATAPTATSTATLPADVPITKLDIIGTAKSFEEVNNFMLTLKRSAFFNPDDTQLLSAGLEAAKNREVPKTTTKDPGVGNKSTRLEFPKVVSYKIQTSLKRIPANDLLRELERKGAVGLVTRLRTLQQQAIKP